MICFSQWFSHENFADDKRNGWVKTQLKTFNNKISIFGQILSLLSHGASIPSELCSLRGHTLIYKFFVQIVIFNFVNPWLTSGFPWQQNDDYKLVLDVRHNQKNSRKVNFPSGTAPRVVILRENHRFFVQLELVVWMTNKNKRGKKMKKGFVDCTQTNSRSRYSDRDLNLYSSRLNLRLQQS